MSHRFGLPKWLFTSDPENQLGSSRLKVDIEKTSFGEGMDFRSFLEFSIGAGATLVIRFTSPVEFVLTKQNISLDNGAIRMAVVLAGTAGGSYNNNLPIIGRNRMLSRPKPYYEPQVTIASGGTHTGGTEVDVARLTSSGLTILRTPVGESLSDERGLPAGIYYIKIANTGLVAATGVYTIAWQERNT